MESIYVMKGSYHGTSINTTDMTWRSLGLPSRCKAPDMNRDLCSWLRLPSPVKTEQSTCSLKRLYSHSNTTISFPYFPLSFTPSPSSWTHGPVCSSAHLFECHDILWSHSPRTQQEASLCILLCDSRVSATSSRVIIAQRVHFTPGTAMRSIVDSCRRKDNWVN